MVNAHRPKTARVERLAITSTQTRQTTLSIILVLKN